MTQLSIGLAESFRDPFQGAIAVATGEEQNEI